MTMSVTLGVALGVIVSVGFIGFVVFGGVAWIRFWLERPRTFWRVVDWSQVVGGYTDLRRRGCFWEPKIVAWARKNKQLKLDLCPKEHWLVWIKTDGPYSSNAGYEIIHRDSEEVEYRRVVLGELSRKIDDDGTTE